MSQPTATHIYILDYNDGVIKVGRTSNVPQRLATLRSEGRQRGAEIRGRWIRRDENARIGEWYLRMLGLARMERAWGTEYFYGDFAQFVDHVERKFAEWGHDASLLADKAAS